MPDRLYALRAWLADLGLGADDLRPASEDASFRRYFRLTAPDGKSRVVMDAPPDMEPLGTFLDIDRRLRAAGLSAPEILACDEARGFLLLEDFGDAHYLAVLDEGNADALYGDAMEAIRVMQTGVAADDLPPYDEALLRREMALFPEWFLGALLGVELSAAQQELWRMTTDRLVASALEQPRAFVHRDYHSRNLMYLESGRNPGLLDFQDAVLGPVTYDLVSLLRDCYIAWPRDRVEGWVTGFLTHARHLRGIEAQRFLLWFDRMGAQRQLKAIGIFARLKLRDGKPGYLRDIPRTLGYLLDACARDPALAELGVLLADLDVVARSEALAGSAS